GRRGRRVETERAGPAQPQNAAALPARAAGVGAGRAVRTRVRDLSAVKAADESARFAGISPPAGGGNYGPRLGCLLHAALRKIGSEARLPGRPCGFRVDREGTL